MLHYTAVFYFIFQSAQPMMYIKVEHFSPENLEYFTQNDRDVSICLTKFISMTADIYIRPLNKFLLRELVAELKTMWLLT